MRKKKYLIELEVKAADKEKEDAQGAARKKKDIDGNITLFGKPSLRILTDEEVNSLRNSEYSNLFDSMTKHKFFPKVKLCFHNFIIHPKQKTNRLCCFNGGWHVFLD